VLVSTKDTIKTFADGALIGSGANSKTYGFYSGAFSRNVAYNCPAGTTAPCKEPYFNSKLHKPFQKFDLKKDLVLGARADLKKDRHFQGYMAMVNLFDGALTDQQANCMFADGDTRLPEAGSSECITADIDITLIGSEHGLDERAENVKNADSNRVLVVHNATVDDQGASFSGIKDYIQINMYDKQYTQGAFSIQFWMTKEDCTGNLYEYMYSHMKNPSLSITDITNPNVNIYLACEHTGGGWSTSGGTVIRYNLVDDSKQWAQFDYPLHDAGHFDSITNIWVQVTLSVESRRIVTFEDGTPVPDASYHFYYGAMGSSNNAYSHPGALSHGMKGFKLESELFLGGRADLNEIATSKVD